MCLLVYIILKLKITKLCVRICYFTFFEKNGDGKITREELIGFLKSYGIDENQAYKSADDLLEAIGSKSGSGGSRIITKSGFKEGAVAFDLSLDETIKKTFNRNRQRLYWCGKGNMALYLYLFLLNKNPLFEKSDPESKMRGGY